MRRIEADIHASRALPAHHDEACEQHEHDGHHHLLKDQGVAHAEPGVTPR